MLFFQTFNIHLVICGVLIRLECIDSDTLEPIDKVSYRDKHTSRENRKKNDTKIEFFSHIFFANLIRAMKTNNVCICTDQLIPIFTHVKRLIKVGDLLEIANRGYALREALSFQSLQVAIF